MCVTRKLKEEEEEEEGRWIFTHSAATAAAARYISAGIEEWRMDRSQSVDSAAGREKERDASENNRLIGRL